MIKTVKIDRVEQLTALISEQEYRTDIDRYRSLYLYRGMLDTSFRMETSLKRNCKHLQQELEPSILQNFTKYAILEDPSIERSVWHQMILGQHHGLPTRLLDWTHSSLIALNFAVSESDMDDMEKHDCMVWRIDMKELHSLLPQEYKNVLDRTNTTVFSLDSLASVTTDLRQYDEDMKDTALCVIEPPSLEQRIVNQYSFFSVIPTGMDDIEGFLDKNTNNTVKYIIDKNLRWRIRDILDHLNISERIVYPGLDGLSKWLGRHYFVK